MHVCVLEYREERVCVCEGGVCVCMCVCWSVGRGGEDVCMCTHLDCSVTVTYGFLVSSHSIVSLNKNKLFGP